MALPRQQMLHAGGSATFNERGPTIGSIGISPNYGGGPRNDFGFTDTYGGVGGVGTGQWNNIPMINPGKYMGGINMVKGGGAYTKGINYVKGGDHYASGIDDIQKGIFKGAYMPGKGSDYYNDQTIDLVDKAGAYAGLEAEAMRNMARMGGIDAAMMASQGLSGTPGMMREMAQGRQLSLLGALSKDIAADKLQREGMIQEGTLARQGGIAAADMNRSSADIAIRQGELNNQQARSQVQMGRQQLRLEGDSARMQGQLQAANIRLSADTARMNGQIARNQLGLSAAMGNQQASIARAQGIQSAQQFNSQMAFNVGQARQQQQQFEAGMSMDIANGMMGAQNNALGAWQNQLGLGASIFQNPAMGYYGSPQQPNRPSFPLIF